LDSGSVVAAGSDVRDAETSAVACTDAAPTTVVPPAAAAVSAAAAAAEEAAAAAAASAAAPTEPTGIVKTKRSRKRADSPRDRRLARDERRLPGMLPGRSEDVGRRCDIFDQAVRSS
jgi:hypothetical protein